MRTLDCFIPVIDNFGDIGFAIQVIRGFLMEHTDWNARVFTTDTAKTEFLLRGTDLERCAIFDASTRNESGFRISETVFCFFGFRLENAVLRTLEDKKRLVQFDYLLLQGPNESHSGISSLHGSTWTDEETSTVITHYVPSLLPEWGGIPLPFGASPVGIPSASERKDGHGTISVFCYGPSEPAIADGIAKALQKDGTTPDIRWFSQSDSVPAEWRTAFLPLDAYPAFLSECEANIVRGENSIVASLLSGKPTLWDPYREKNGQEREKLEDFLSFLETSFPEHAWTIYRSISVAFVDADPEIRANAVFRFLSERKKLKENFESIPAWIRKNANLQKKLEQTIWFFS